MNLPKWQWDAQNIKRAPHLILSQSRMCSYCARIFSHNHPFIIESELILHLTGCLDWPDKKVSTFLAIHPVMQWTRQQLRGGHKREAFANRVMDTHARQKTVTGVTGLPVNGGSQPSGLTQKSAAFWHFKISITNHALYVTKSGNFSISAESRLRNKFTRNNRISDYRTSSV